MFSHSSHATVTQEYSLLLKYPTSSIRIFSPPPVFCTLFPNFEFFIATNFSTVNFLQAFFQLYFIDSGRGFLHTFFTIKFFVNTYFLLTLLYFIQGVTRCTATQSGGATEYLHFFFTLVFRFRIFHRHRFFWGTFFRFRIFYRHQFFAHDQDKIFHRHQLFYTCFFHRIFHKSQFVCLIFF